VIDLFHALTDSPSFAFLKSAHKMLEWLPWILRLVRHFYLSFLLLLIQFDEVNPQQRLAGKLTSVIF
jgi:hypothetical protein